MHRPDKMTGFDLAKIAKESDNMQKEINEAIMKQNIKNMFNPDGEK
jgi:hypothetical protein